MTVFMPFQVFRWLLYTRNCNVLGRLCSSDNAYSSASEPRLLRSNTWCYLHNSKTILFSFEIAVYTTSISSSCVCIYKQSGIITSYCKVISISSRQESHKDKLLDCFAKQCLAAWMIVCMLNDYKSQSNWHLSNYIYAHVTYVRAQICKVPATCSIDLSVINSSI